MDTRPGVKFRFDLGPVFHLTHPSNTVICAIMKKRRHREPLDWSRSTEEHPHQETMAEEMASLIHPRARGQIYAAASILGLVMNDIDAEEGYVQRCPKCRHRSLRRVRPEDKASPEDSTWRCFECGNDADEFGNKL